MSRHRPSLEALERRYAPAVAGDVTTGAADSARVAGAFEGGAAPAPVVVLPAGPIQVYAPAPSGLGGGRVFFSAPGLPDVLMSQIGRLPEPSLKFPASGGGQAKASEETAQLTPVVTPPAPAGAYSDDGAAAEVSPDGGDAEVA